MRILTGILAAVLSLAMTSADSEKPLASKPTTKPATQPVRRDIGVEEFEKLWKEKKYVILDVRTPREYQAGHIPGSVNIDFNAVDFEKRIKELEKGKPYLIHCASGVRSARACDRMKVLSFSELYNLQGGIKAWQKEGRPVVE
jgi:phage shock protein E